MISAYGTCDRCRYSQLSDQLGARILVCKLNPAHPTLVPSALGQPILTAVYPPVSEHTGCWQFCEDPAGGKAALIASAHPGRL